MSETQNETRVQLDEPEKKVRKVMTHEETRALVKKSAIIPIDPTHLLEKVALTIHDYPNHSSDDKEFMDQFRKDMNDVLPVIAMDTHYALAQSVIEDLRTLAIDFANQLTLEYDCKTPTEKALVEVAAAAYIRVLQFTGYMTRLARDERVSMLLSGAYKVASQELDRANRHFLSTITALKQIKSPAMTVQVKATNAFVAQNQQVNATSPMPNAGNDQPVYANVNPT